MEELSINQLFLNQNLFFSGRKSRPIDFRIDQLRKLKKSILTHEKDIYKALYLDLKKSTEESFFSEIGLVLNEIDNFISHLRSWSKPNRVSSPLYLLPSQSYILYEPLGVCLIIAPFNYPFQLSILPLVGVLAAGNCAMVKGSEHTPHTNKLLGHLFSTCFPLEYVAFLCGDAEESHGLVKLPFDKIFFTGSSTVGKKVLSAAAVNLTPVVLELGGKSPCIVDKSAHIQLTARRIVWGKFMNAGQTCIAPDFVIVHNSIKNILLTAMILEIEKLYGRDASRSAHYGKIIHAAAWDRIVSMIDLDAVIYGGKSDKSSLFIEPTILDCIDLNARCMQEEIFGPLLPVLSFENADDLPGLLPKEKPLALYVFGSNVWAQSILEKFPSGGGCINDTMIHFSNIKLPFGGIGSSGLGHYHGRNSFLCFSHQRSIMRSFIWIDLFFRYPPFRLYSWVKYLFRF